jgi:hypothetical protein
MSHVALTTRCLPRVRPPSTLRQVFAWRTRPANDRLNEFQAASARAVRGVSLLGACCRSSERLVDWIDRSLASDLPGARSCCT